MADPKLIIRILTDAKEASAGIGEANSKFSKFDSTMKGLVGPATAVLGGITALGVGALNAASDVQQGMGGVEAVFGRSAGQIKKWANESSQAVGLSKAEYANYATLVGGQLKNLGVPMDQVVGKTGDMIQMAADLASTYGGTTQQAVEALGSALRGEADPAEAFNLQLSQTKVNAYLAAKGMDKLKGDALVNAKAQAVMALATEQSADAAGNFAKESDTLAGQQARLTSGVKDTAAAFGEALLPVVTPVVQAMAGLAEWVKQNVAWIGPLIAIVAALAAGVIAYTAVQWALNAAMAANPIGLVVIAIGALVAGFIALWNSNEEFRNAFINGWQQISSFFSSVWSTMVAIWNAVVAGFKNGLKQIQTFFTNVFNGIKAVITNVVNFFKTAWQIAVTVVTAYINVYKAIFLAIFNAVRVAINAVVNFFKSAWQNAVNAVKGVLNVFKGIAISVFNAIKGPIQAVVGFFNGIVSAIQNVISWLGRIKIPDIFGGITSLFSGGVSAAPPTPAVYAAPPVPGFSTRGAGGVAAGALVGSSKQTTINVAGGLDSADAIARRIQQVLQQRDRRAHGVTISRSLR